MSFTLLAMEAGTAYRFQNHASTTGDHSSFRLYGQVLSENNASWEYESRGFRRNGRVPKVMPMGMPCNLRRWLSAPGTNIIEQQAGCTYRSE